MRTKLFLFIVACLSTIQYQASAQKELGVFNSLAVGVSASTTGIGVDLATPITPYLALRGGVSIMPNFNINTDVDLDLDFPGAENYSQRVDLTGKTKRTTGELILNVYPFPKATTFFVAAGLSFGGSKLVQVDGHSDGIAQAYSIPEVAEYIKNNNIPVDKNGNVSGGLEVGKVRPYLGLGFGRVVPKKRVGVQFELGVQFHGTPEIYTTTGDLDALLAQDPDNTITDIVDKITVYPVMKIRFCGRLF